MNDFLVLKTKQSIEFKPHRMHGYSFNLDVLLIMNLPKTKCIELELQLSKTIYSLYEKIKFEYDKHIPATIGV